MASSIARMTKDELKELLESVVEQKLIEVLEQSGRLIGRQSVRSRRTPSSSTLMTAGETDEVSSSINMAKVVDKEGVLVIRVDSHVELSNIPQQERSRRITKISNQEDS